ncbi:hypothetical protein C8F04DRAFT_1395821 [Mycena alexandri]|uniref:Uncharacterized protein n=1 Tax=Mycena alexandri TaxID=1745969 RepID=A0AAD6X3U0_9AGAR|nr:hypothetical protein C8F04DRAFT_1395821 [Mycena alexandri]
MASVRSQQLRSLFHLVVTKCGWRALRGAIQYCPNCITDRPLEDLTFAPIQLTWACKVYQVEERDLRIAAEALWYAIRFAKEDPDLNPTAAELNDEIQYIQGKPSQALQDEARANTSKALRENVPEGERWEASILAFKEKELFPWGYGKYRTQVEKKPKRSHRKSNKTKEDAEQDENEEAYEDESEDTDEENRKIPKRTNGKSKHKSEIPEHPLK